MKIDTIKKFSSYLDSYGSSFDVQIYGQKRFTLQNFTFLLVTQPFCNVLKKY